MKRITISIIAVIIIVLAVYLFSAPGFEPQQIDIGDSNDAVPMASAESMIPGREKHESAAFALVGDMKAGWNLGNALDSLDHQKAGINYQLQVTPEEYYETLWGNPVTTSKTISDIAEMGFGAVRVPVTWQDHMNDEFIISEAWLERVAQVVDDVLDNDMYCIINLHHDVGSGSWPWLVADPEKLDELTGNLRTVWEQIAIYFQDYSYKLLFEGFNEILDASSRWTGSTDECYEAVNKLNQAFVDTVRTTGGLNSNRFLVISSYAASVDSGVLRHFRMPEDTIEDHIVVSVHTYTPAGFTWHKDMATWTEVYSEWDNEKGRREIEAMLSSVRTHLVDKGIPVIISECGAWNKNNSPGRIAYANALVHMAARDQIACFWWDEGGKAENGPESVRGTALYDRYNEVWLFPEVAEAFVKAADDAWAD